MVEIDELLAKRAKTHGDFAVHAAATQGLKDIIRVYCDVYRSNTSKLDPCMREALDMIAHKIGRILAGDPTHKDHWDDIAGYALLVAKRLK